MASISTFTCFVQEKRQEFPLSGELGTHPSPSLSHTALFNYFFNDFGKVKCSS